LVQAFANTVAEEGHFRWEAIGWVRIRGHQFRRKIRQAQREKSVGDLPEQ